MHIPVQGIQLVANSPLFFKPYTDCPACMYCSRELFPNPGYLWFSSPYLELCSWYGRDDAVSVLLPQLSQWLEPLPGLFVVQLLPRTGDGATDIGQCLSSLHHAQLHGLTAKEHTDQLQRVPTCMYVCT